MSRVVHWTTLLKPFSSNRPENTFVVNQLPSFSAPSQAPTKLTLRRQFDRRLQRRPDVDTASSCPDPLRRAHPAECRSHRCDSTCTCPSRFETRRRLTSRRAFRCCKRNQAVNEIIRCRCAKAAYTSTMTGKAASLSSSRQLGGKRICTAARVPCVSVISNERCVGSASSSSFLENCFRVSYNTLISLWFFAECTPVRRRKERR